MPKTQKITPVPSNNSKTNTSGRVVQTQIVDGREEADTNPGVLQ